MLSYFRVMMLKPWWCAFVVSVGSLSGWQRLCAIDPFLLPLLVLSDSFLLLAKGVPP